MTIADMKIGQPDRTGETVVIFYGFNPPHYAVYGTDQRVVIQYADSPAEQASQRNAAAPLNPLRGEINGLIDGWRSSRMAGRMRKARHYDRRVADALGVALESDLDGAKDLLTAIRQDITDERTGWARLEYLLFALVVSLFAIGIGAAGAARVTTGAELWRAAGAGATGAFFSIALGIRSRTVLTDLHRTANATDAVLRVVIGIIAAIVLAAFVMAKVVKVQIGEASFDLTQGDPWLLAFIIGFLGGFSERLVPDLLSRAALDTQTPSDPAVKLMPRQHVAAAAAVAGPMADAAVPGPGVGGDAADALPQEAHLDHCLCDLDLSNTPATPDDLLPAAAGGVAPDSATKGNGA